MICALTVRKLKPGTFEEFRAAFRQPMQAGNPPEGFVRFNMLRSTENPDEVICFGFFDRHVRSCEPRQTSSATPSSRRPSRRSSNRLARMGCSTSSRTTRRRATAGNQSVRHSAGAAEFFPMPRRGGLHGRPDNETDGDRCVVSSKWRS